MNAKTFKPKKGFKAVKEEGIRREKEKEASKGKLWRIFFAKNDPEDLEIPFLFLTDEPQCYYEHQLNINGKVVNRACTGDDCKDCASGNKARFVGAFLGVDCRPFEVEVRDKDGNKTGKKKTVDYSAKLLVRGQTDLSQLDRLNNKYGLLDREWYISKTGTGTATKWSFDRGDDFELSEKEIQAILPESLRGMDFDDIVLQQISPTEEDYEEETSDEEIDKKVSRGVRRVQEEDDNSDDDDRDARRPSRNAKKASASKPSKLIKKSIRK